VKSAIEAAQEQKTQRRYARLAGFLLLWLILNGLVSTLILSQISGDGSFAETAKRIAASERLYRVALSAGVIETLSSVLLAFAFYVTLKPVNTFLAQLAMIFNLQDSFLACLVRAGGFVRLHFYTSSQSLANGPVAPEAFVDLTHSIGGITENIGGICFGIGSALFFYLFFRSSYIPRALSVLGLFASVIWTAMYFANLVFPEQHATFQYICFPPMALAEVTTGFYLALFAVRSQGREDQSRRPVVAGE
jgi:Domain of unknown function (DUF4386)